MSDGAEGNKLNNFDMLLVRQFSEKLQEIKSIEVSNRFPILSESLSKEALALQQIAESYEELDDVTIDNIIMSINSALIKNDDEFSKGFLNVKRGDA